MANKQDALRAIRLVRNNPPHTRNISAISTLFLECVGKNDHNLRLMGSGNASDTEKASR
jgi:hypothetical protein